MSDDVVSLILSGGTWTLRIGLRVLGLRIAYTVLLGQLTYLKLYDVVVFTPWESTVI